MDKAQSIAATETAADATENLMRGFRLGEFDVHPREERIIGPDGAVHLEPKVMQVLVMLACHAGEPITREQLLNEVWSDTIVGDEVLSRAISLLRGALHDERTNPRYIRTLPRRGYELISKPQSLRQAPTIRSRFPLYLAASLALLALIAGSWLYRNQDQTPIAVAVIPFTTGSSDPEEPLLGDSLADYLISALTRSPQLGIVSRHSSFALRDSTMDVRDMGDLLDAEYLIEGALSRAHNQIMLTLSLVESATGKSLWTSQLTGSEDNIAQFQDEALSALSKTLQKHLKIKALVPQERKGSPDTDAYRSFLEARYQWSLRGERRIQRAIELLQQAIAQQPDFAQAHLALAQSQAVAPLYQTNTNTDASVETGFALARTSAARALELDPALSADVAALEGCMAMYEMRWELARTLLQTSLADNPNNPLAHYWYSLLLSRFGEFDAALEHIQISARLDPLSAAINNRLALAYLWMNEDAEAGRQFQVASSLGFIESIQVKPFLLFALRQKRYQDIERSLLALGNSPTWVSPFVEALNDASIRPAAAAVIDEAITAGQVDRNFWFGIWIFLQDPDRALRDFDAGLKSQDIELLWARESEFLRQDPRFGELLAQVNLSP